MGKTWLAKFSPTKTEAVNFTRKKNTTDSSLLMDNTSVKNVRQHKHLGLVLEKEGK